MGKPIEGDAESELLCRPLIYSVLEQFRNSDPKEGMIAAWVAVFVDKAVTNFAVLHSLRDMAQNL